MKPVADLAVQYTDMITNEVLLTDYDCREKPSDPFTNPRDYGFRSFVHDMIMEVDGKRSQYFRSVVWKLPVGSPDHVKSFPFDLVDYYRLRERKFDNVEELEAYLDEYILNLAKFLSYGTLPGDEEARKLLIRHKNKIIEFIKERFNNLRIFFGRNHGGGPVFQYKNKPNTLMYFVFGLSPVISDYPNLRFGLLAPLDTISEGSTSYEGSAPDQVSFEAMPVPSYEVCAPNCGPDQLSVSFGAMSVPSCEDCAPDQASFGAMPGPP